MAVESLTLQFGLFRCCGRSPQWRHFPHVFLYVLILSSVHRSSQVLEFLEEPSLYYYTRPTYSTIIRCLAADMDGTSAPPTYVESTAFINGTSFSRGDMLPPFHEFWIRNKVVSGILVTDTTPGFSGWTYGCSAEYAGQTITSGNATLFVGDGRPLAPTEDPMYMTENGLSSLTIVWAFAPVPPDGPLQGYNISYTSLNDSTVQENVETSDNNTMVRLESLRPGETYSVTVQGYNRYGGGEWSAPLVFTVMVGSVPPAPAKVMAHSLESSQSQFISLSVKWTEVEVEPAESTPVLEYSIYCYDLASTNHLIKTVNSSQTSATVELNNKVASPFKIGVAARNLAGYGDITYDPFLFTLKPITPTKSAQVSTPVLIGAIAAAVVIFCILCVLVFIIILYLSRKTKSLNSKYSFSGADSESPETTPEIMRKKFEEQNGDSKLDDKPVYTSGLKKSESIEMMDTRRGSSEVRVIRPKRERLRSVDAVNPVRLSYYDSKTL